MKRSRIQFVFKPEFGSRVRNLRHIREVAALAARIFDAWKSQLLPKPEASV
jgi:hypothetical protein